MYCPEIKIDYCKQHNQDSSKIQLLYRPSGPIKFSLHISFLLQLMAVAAAKCASAFSYGEIETWKGSMTCLFWIM